MRRLNKQLQFAVNFAHFCKENDCEPADLAEAIQAVENSVHASERDDCVNENKWGQRFVQIANQKLNCSDVQWPGLYPIFKDKSGHERMLPD